MKKIILLLSLIVALTACNRNGDKKAQLEKLIKDHDKIAVQIQELEKELGEGSDQKKKIVPVIVTDIKPIVFKNYIEVQGKVDGDENVSVSARTVGVVMSINVMEGQKVSKGQTLATLDAQVLYATLKDMETQLDFVKDLYTRQKSLWDQKIGSEVQYLTAKNNKESLESKIKTMKDQIAMSSITSPINGNVEEISLKVGQSISPGYPTFRVVNFDKVKIVAEVAEAYSSKIRLGDSVRIFFPDFNEEISSKLSFTSKYINSINRTFIVEARIKQKTSHEFRANMIAVIKINDYVAPNAIAVSTNVIHKSMNEKFVFVAVTESGKKIAKKRTVTTGITYNGLTEILSGLKPGDKLITTGYADLNENDMVNY